MTRGFRGAVTVGCASVWILVTGCTAYDEDLLSPRSETSVGEGGVMTRDGGGGMDSGAYDAGGWFAGSCRAGECFWSDPPGDGECRSTRVPDESWRPDGTSSEEIAPIYFGMSRLWTGASFLDGRSLDTGATADGGQPDGSSEPWRTFGFDLDGVCTRADACGASAGAGEFADEQPAVSCRPGGVQLPVDGELCRDNSFARLQPVAGASEDIGGVFGLREEIFNCELWRGSYNIITRLSGYNGRADDEQVRVDFYTSSGLERQPPWTCPRDDFRDRHPLWRASSEWEIVRSSVQEESGDADTLPPSRTYDEDAFVRDGYLVARLPDDAPYRLGSRNAAYPGWAMTIQKGYWVARIRQREDQTWKLTDGLVAGRLEKESVLRSFRQLGLCPDGDTQYFYDVVADYLDDNADLLASGEVDPEAECDALSVGFAFEATQTSVGSVEEAPPLVDCCEPENEDAPTCRVGCGDGRLFGDEECDTGIPEGEPGACPTACPSTDPCKPQVLIGSGCQAHCVEEPIQEIEDGDGCCPPGANATTDSDCGSVCGNQVLESGETCDPPESCPSSASCQPEDACGMAMLQGSASMCTAVCQHAAITACTDGDGCCPNGCRNEPGSEGPEQDADCPVAGLCDNGSLDEGETCDDRTDTPCPQSPAECDDGRSCTEDVVVGDAQRCTARCSHPEITQPRDGDGCCPSGATSVTDSDCGAVCGNGTQEQGEACDDGNREDFDGCSSDCEVESDQEICSGTVGQETSDACRACTCSQCAPEALECFVNYSDAENLACGNVVRCGRNECCTDVECYCGSQSEFSCGLFGGNGPCQQVIRTATRDPDDPNESVNVFTVLDRRDNTAYPIGRAGAFGACIDQNCAAECLQCQP